MGLKKFWNNLKGWQKGGTIGLSVAIVLIILFNINYTSQISFVISWYIAFPVIVTLTILETMFNISPNIHWSSLITISYLSSLGILFGFLYDKKDKKIFIKILIIFWSINFILALLTFLFFTAGSITKIS